MKPSAAAMHELLAITIRGDWRKLDESERATIERLSHRLQSRGCYLSGAEYRTVQRLAEKACVRLPWPDPPSHGEDFATRIANMRPLSPPSRRSA